MSDKEFKEHLTVYQQAPTGTTEETRAYNKIYPTIRAYLSAAISNTHIYDFLDVQPVDDTYQIILMKSVVRLKTRIKPDGIRTVKGLLFSMFSNLCRNEIDKLIRDREKKCDINKIEKDMVLITAFNNIVEYEDDNNLDYCDDNLQYIKPTYTRVIEYLNTCNCLYNCEG